jgi:AcrR family transcriptional regulator
VVADVLDACLQVFAESGYAGLSIEEVARRAGVNKTTVYRRWPTRAELVGAALFSLRDHDPPLPDTGSLRSDLVSLLVGRVEQMITPHRRAIMQAVMVGYAEPELRTIVKRLRQERPLIPRAVFERALARGELPPGTDVGMLAELLLGPLHTRIYWKREAVTADYIETLVAWVVAGAPRVPAQSPARSAPNTVSPVVTKKSKE